MEKTRQENNIKYDFSNPESQKLFSEFAVLLADITKYIEEKEQHIIYLEKESAKEMRIRQMVKIILRKLSDTFCRSISAIPKKLFNTIKEVKSKLRGMSK